LACQNEDVEFGFRTLSKPGELMSEVQKSKAVAPTEPSGLDLFMTVMIVRNWSMIVPWYIDTPGLVLVLVDAKHKFAFLATGNGRLGLKGTKTTRAVEVRSKARVVVQVRNVVVSRDSRGLGAH
jgi:hypothetical protein